MSEDKPSTPGTSLPPVPPREDDVSLSARHPTWVLRTRIPGSLEWIDRRVAARSVLQAEAILRRKGFEVDMAGSRVVDARPDDLDRVQMVPGMLNCTHCGYVLNGLTVHDAVIDCPECGFGQIVLAFTPGTGLTTSEQARGVKVPKSSAMLWKLIVGVLAVLGAIFTLLLVLASVGASFSY